MNDWILFSIGILIGSIGGVMASALFKAISACFCSLSLKSSIVNLLQDYNVVSVTPEVIDLETTKVVPTVTFKYDANATTKTTDALATLITNAITTYSTTELEQFEKVFRFSPFTTSIDDVDPAVLSNITTINISKTFKPTLGSALKYTISFSNSLYHPFTGYNLQTGGVSHGGILTSTGFTIFLPQV